MIKLLIGGSPCTHWSIAQKKNRETTADGMGWELFKNYLIAREKFQPDFFLYENNKSAAQAIKDQIAYELGVGTDSKTRFTYINSGLVSAQNRHRFYVTNFGDIEQPQDRGITLRDIIDGDFYGLFSDYNNSTTYEKGRTIGTGVGTPRSSTHQQVILYPVKIKKIAKGGQLDKVYEIEFEDGTRKIDSVKSYVRNLTPVECERLQTMPDGYTKAVSNTQRYKGLGNGWTAEVIIHLLNHALKDVPRDEEIIVLSMYDGIGTGRYCLEKMGFTNIEYHAYEIDKYAMAIAKDNYPDIIYHGDAFGLRDDAWNINVLSFDPQLGQKWPESERINR